MPMTASWPARRMSSDLMKDGAKVLEVGVPLRESRRLCLELFVASNVSVDWVRICVGGVDRPLRWEGEASVDFGRAGDEMDAFRTNGLLRLFSEPLPCEAIVGVGEHRLTPRS